MDFKTKFVIILDIRVSKFREHRITKNEAKKICNILRRILFVCIFIFECHYDLCHRLKILEKLKRVSEEQVFKFSYLIFSFQSINYEWKLFSWKYDELKIFSTKKIFFNVNESRNTSEIKNFKIKI